MMSFMEPKLEIVQCDNGYVVEWRKERPKNSASWPEEPTTGVKIFKDAKEVVGFLSTFFGKP